MKYFALLFAIYLSVLTIAPMAVRLMPCTLQNSHLMDCCDKKNECNDKGSKSNCPFGICCNNCLFFHQASEKISFKSSFAKREMIINKDDHLISSYISDCWHPPENCRIIINSVKEITHLK